MALTEKELLRLSNTGAIATDKARRCDINGALQKLGEVVQSGYEYVRAHEDKQDVKRGDTPDARRVYEMSSNIANSIADALRFNCGCSKTLK